MKTTPPSIAGELLILLPILRDHFGAPVAASYARTIPSSAPPTTTPAETAGDERTGTPPGVAHRGTSPGAFRSAIVPSGLAPGREALKRNCSQSQPANSIAATRATPSAPRPRTGVR